MALAIFVPAACPPASSSTAEPLEVVVHIDRDLGLQTTVIVPAGATVKALKEQICEEDVTGEMAVDGFELARSGFRRLPGDRILTTDDKELDLICDWEDEGEDEPAEIVLEPPTASERNVTAPVDVPPPEEVGEGVDQPSEAPEAETSEAHLTAEDEEVDVAPEEAGAEDDPWAQQEQPDQSAEVDDFGTDSGPAAGEAEQETAEAGPRKCKHPKCLFLVHSNPTNAKTHCCFACQKCPDSVAPRHGPACEGVEANPAPLAEDGPEHRIFELLDSKSKGQVGKRDIVLGLKKHAPVRKLFGFPVGTNEPGGDELESRLLSVQEAFESGSGLGELTAVWESFLKALDPEFGGSSFTWEMFAARVRKPPMKQRVTAASQFLHREHSAGEGPAFIATPQWKEVPEGYLCPGGLEYKMDMTTQKTLARLIPGDAKKPRQGSPARPAPAPRPPPTSPGPLIAPSKPSPTKPAAAPSAPPLQGGIQQWEVVGGVDKGGVLVRSGIDLQSPQEGARLSTSALVEELELIGERLHFRRLTGTGPAEGWVSIKLGAKTLMERRGVGAPDVD